MKHKKKRKKKSYTLVGRSETLEGKMSCLTKESEVTRMLLAEKLKKAMGLTKPRGGGG